MTARSVMPLASGLGFAEGLRWHDGRLWFSDFLQHRVSSIDLDGRACVEVALDDRPSGLGWLPDGRLLIVSMHDRVVLRRELSGQIVLHADLSTIATFHANDMVVATDGTAYVGNFGFDILGGGVRRTAQLAIVRPDGTVFGGPEDLEFPNGSVITPDGRSLIVGESSARRYRAFPLLPDGTLGQGSVWAELGDHSPDGCALDAEGAIWFADPAGGQMVRVREGGEILETFPMEDVCYACALGGPEGRTLFVATSATQPGPDAPIGTGRLWHVEVDVPHAGRP